MAGTNKIAINAILGEEFLRLLEKLGIVDDVKLGKYKCHVCDDQIGLENALIIFPITDKEVGFICDKPLCLRK